MKLHGILFILAATSLSAASARADVAITQLEDRFRIEVDGELFSEWRHKEWAMPYLYPVIGPNGQNVTRHFPMRDDVEGESHDHAHHRAIRFSHRGINGFSFWGPDYDKEKKAECVLEKVEKMEGGKASGELVIWNRWLGDGKLILHERLRLKFTPLENRQMLLDYDTTLHAPEVDATFVDQKDGGLSIRVASWIRVEKKDKTPGKGTMINSEGDRNKDAWGKRAKWVDYYGVDKDGKKIGIAMFDHNSNLYYPTHWHARTYGLLTANRFGKGHFERSQGAKVGDGDYTIKKGESLALRHRFYFHHGDTETGKVADQFAKYIEEK